MVRTDTTFFEADGDRISWQQPSLSEWTNNLNGRHRQVSRVSSPHFIELRCSAVQCSIVNKFEYWGWNRSFFLLMSNKRRDDRRKFMGLKWCIIYSVYFNGWKTHHGVNSGDRLYFFFLFRCFSKKQKALFVDETHSFMQFLAVE